MIHSLARMSCLSIFNCVSQITDFALPLELHRNPSMQNLRNRRNPHYQGIRHRRAKRVIDKSGERNVGFLHIPERSRRFFKDFVTTFVSDGTLTPS